MRRLTTRMRFRCSPSALRHAASATPPRAGAPHPAARALPALPSIDAWAAPLGVALAHPSPFVHAFASEAPTAAAEKATLAKPPPLRGVFAGRDVAAGEALAAVPSGAALRGATAAALLARAAWTPHGPLSAASGTRFSTAGVPAAIAAAGRAFARSERAAAGASDAPPLPLTARGPLLVCAVLALLRLGAVSDTNNEPPHALKPAAATAASNTATTLASGACLPPAAALGRWVGLFPPSVPPLGRIVSASAESPLDARTALWTAGGDTGGDGESGAAAVVQRRPGGAADVGAQRRRGAAFLAEASALDAQASRLAAAAATAMRRALADGAAAEAALPSVAEFDGAWRWALFALRSRCVALPAAESRDGAASGGGFDGLGAFGFGAASSVALEAALVPLLDMLNHAPSPQSVLGGFAGATAAESGGLAVANVAFAVGPVARRLAVPLLVAAAARRGLPASAAVLADAGVIVLTATRPVRRGEEFTLDYGDAAQRALLLFPDLAAGAGAAGIAAGDAPRLTRGPAAAPLPLVGGFDATDAGGVAAAGGAFAAAKRRAVADAVSRLDAEQLSPVFDASATDGAAAAARLRTALAADPARWAWTFGFARPASERAFEASFRWASSLDARLRRLTDIRRRGAPGEFVVGVPEGLARLRAARGRLAARYGGAVVHPAEPLPTAIAPSKNAAPAPSGSNAAL